MNSYQKVKSENEELRKQIEILLDKPDSTQALEIKMRHTIKKQPQHAVWFGNPQNINTGTLTQIIQ